MIAVIIVFIPTAILLCFVENLLLLIKLDPDSAHYAQIYCYGMIPAMLFHSQFDAIRQYLNAIQKSYIFMKVVFITSALHLIWCYLFVVRFQMGFIGIPFAATLTCFLNFFLLHIYCSTLKDIKESYFQITKESF